MVLRIAIQDLAATYQLLCLDFHEELDVISVHEGLLQEFRTVMTNVRTRQPVDGQVDTIYAAKGSHLAGRSAFTHVSNLCRHGTQH